ncbi:hypothetical protein NQ646_00955 [Acinetobacter baumannii]|nr:hypothetical protein [Acinetobacter baumannii]
MDMELYKSVVDFVRNHNKASTSHIQRAFNLSYNRAVPIMDKLEEDYVISPMSANGKREVYPEIVAELQQQIKVLTADLKESQSDFAYAYKSVTSWTERAYKQREKVELIKNEVERFQQSGSPLDLNQFLSNLIQLATFKNDNEFTDHLLVPAQKFFTHDFNGDGFKYHDSLEEAQKEAEVNLDYYRDRVADGHHVADEGEFFELCYGVVIASAGYTVDDVVTEDHHKKDEFTKYEVGTEILSLHFNKCNSESGAEG